jgi:antitoxin (DNA-binding transcriptional repressor) of toxin-antitoxin stability system
MERMISESLFKQRSLEYFRLIGESGEALIITDRGQLVLKIIPYTADLEDRMKILRNSVLKYDDPTEPVAPEDWESLQRSFWTRMILSLELPHYVKKRFDIGLRDV